MVHTVHTDVHIQESSHFRHFHASNTSNRKDTPIKLENLSFHETTIFPSSSIPFGSINDDNQLLGAGFDHFLAQESAATAFHQMLVGIDLGIHREKRTKLAEHTIEDN